MIAINSTKKVLIVDDDPAVTQMMMILLKSRQYEPVCASTGADAIAYAQHNDVSMILLDIILPDMNGFEVCNALKSHPDTQAIPVIIISSRFANEDKVHGLHLGADDYLVKPFENEELFARIDAVLRRHRGDTHERQEKQKIEIIQELKRIIDNELITSVYQPIFLLEPYCILGFEVLARPQTDTVLSNPELLFKAAMQYDMYYQTEMISWKKGISNSKDSLTSEQLFFNCNPYLIEHANFDQARKVFSDGGIEIERVVLELTERSAIIEYKSFYERLNRLRKEGFRFAVDDVGGGYASLESIVETKPEVVKIDRHIIAEINSDPVKLSIVKFIISFCQENNIISIAEGVESKVELDAVRELGIDAVQGYYLCRPTDKINVSQILSKKLN